MAVAQHRRCRTVDAASRGLSLVEVVVSTLIVGMMTVAALHTLGAATRSGASAGNRAVALGLADELMAEILAENYDDLDDYHNHNEALVGDHAGWTRRSTVQRVQPVNLTQTTPGNVEQGAKRIRVLVAFEGRDLAEQFAIRTDNE